MSQVCFSRGLWIITFDLFDNHVQRSGACQSMNVSYRMIHMIWECIYGMMYIRYDTFMPLWDWCDVPVWFIPYKRYTLRIISFISFDDASWRLATTLHFYKSHVRMLSGANGIRFQRRLEESNGHDRSKLSQSWLLWLIKMTARRSEM